MNKATFVKEITVIDPDTKGNVQIAIYKHEAGGMFGIDASFLLEFEDKITIPDVFSNPTRKVLLLEGEENQRDYNIRRIKDIIKTWGNFNISDIEGEDSPIISSTGNGRNNIFVLIEGFNSDEVHTITYHDELEIDENFISYEELSDEIIEEVLRIIEVYEADMLRTEKRCND